MLRRVVVVFGDIVVIVVAPAGGGLDRHVDRIRCPPGGSWKVLSETSIRILPASRYIFAVQRASYSICSTPKAPEQSPCSHVSTRVPVWMPGRRRYVHESICVCTLVGVRKSYILWGRGNGTGRLPLVLHPVLVVASVVGAFSRVLRWNADSGILSQRLKTMVHNRLINQRTCEKYLVAISTAERER